jgi:hypothetical protein
MKHRARGSKRRLEKRPAKQTKDLEERIALARELAASPTVTVTLRIPIRLNEWLDTYVHEGWRKDIRKQALVAEALKLLIATHGGFGKERFSKDLLGEEADP